MKSGNTLPPNSESLFAPRSTSVSEACWAVLQPYKVRKVQKQKKIYGLSDPLHLSTAQGGAYNNPLPRQSKLTWLMYSLAYEIDSSKIGILFRHDRFGMRFGFVTNRDQMSNHMKISERLCVDALFELALGSPTNIDRKSAVYLNVLLADPACCFHVASRVLFTWSIHVAVVFSQSPSIWKVLMYKRTLWRWSSLEKVFLTGYSNLKWHQVLRTVVSRSLLL